MIDVVITGKRLGLPGGITKWDHSAHIVLLFPWRRDQRYVKFRSCPVKTPGPVLRDSNPSASLARA